MAQTHVPSVNPVPKSNSDSWSFMSPVGLLAVILIIAVVVIAIFVRRRVSQVPKVLDLFLLHFGTQTVFCFFLFLLVWSGIISFPDKWTGIYFFGGIKRNADDADFRR